MIEGIPKISVLVITYKQEDIVGRTLDSLISQRDYLYEICISDDCSPDGTWDVLQDYQKRYPDLIKLHRQDPNVGIFENTEYSWTMPTGDIINEIAGDDTTPEGWYKAVIDYIIKKNIDYKNELFCVYGDFAAIYPNGDSMLFRQNAVLKKPNDALRMAIRGIIGGRGCCYSVKILHKFEKVSQGRSHIAEMAQDRQLQCLSQHNYYIPNLSNVYYTGIGISAHINDQIYNERMEIWPYFIKYLQKKGINLSQSDIYFGKYEDAKLRLRKHRSIANFFQTIIAYIFSLDLTLPRENELKHLIFAIIRRLPHKKPIAF